MFALYFIANEVYFQSALPVSYYLLLVFEYTGYILAHLPPGDTIATTPNVQAYL